MFRPRARCPPKTSHNAHECSKQTGTATEVIVSRDNPYPFVKSTTTGYYSYYLSASHGWEAPQYDLFTKWFPVRLYLDMHISQPCLCLASGTPYLCGFLRAWKILESGFACSAAKKMKGYAKQEAERFLKARSGSVQGMNSTAIQMNDGT